MAVLGILSQKLLEAMTLKLYMAPHSRSCTSQVVLVEVVQLNLWSPSTGDTTV